MSSTSSQPSSTPLPVTVSTFSSNGDTEMETLLGLIKNLSLLDFSMVNLSNSGLISLKNYTLFNNITLSLDIEKPFARRTELDDDYLEHRPALQVFFYCLYALIFLVGICGNTLVCYVVFRNKQMHTVTNLFITNLALSDILLCIFSVPITPLYLIFYKEWVFGRILCHLVPYAQGVSVYISAFTLMSIAIDRFFVIIYPFKPRMRINVCLTIITFVWISAALLTLPYGLFVKMASDQDERWLCDEFWPVEESRKAFGFSTSVLQFVIPFTIITFCYIRVCGKLRDRARSKPGEKSVKKDEIERERTKRTNRMLIAMVAIFGISWLPLNIHNLVTDFYIPASEWRYFKPFFFLVHAVAMSSTCYNPFLYAWLNENFRKEFKQVLPCYTNSGPPFSYRRGTSVAGAGLLPANGQEGEGACKTNETMLIGNNRDSAKSDKTCNGHELIHRTCDSQKSCLTAGQDENEQDNDDDEKRPITTATMETKLGKEIVSMPTSLPLSPTNTMSSLTTTPTTKTVEGSLFSDQLNTKEEFNRESIELTEQQQCSNKKVNPSCSLLGTRAVTSLTYNSDSDTVRSALGDSVASQVV
ncbi:prolactin-releasing peptide receptor-like [Tetranychus urticae]|nr:prolactin-releasing peptide receptor-like [Tetranychus urticae]XP_015792350.1 prolactin-releasing peptide receptor-like [Tetranychus urticae]XP_025018002.1 prolactin-releasing peptide receptor-like [Tetranychus urticae]XP_025018003.1 prolactin-releasing peptide receptor-like [Tetranychus urticae]